MACSLKLKGIEPVYRCDNLVYTIQTQPNSSFHFGRSFQGEVFIFIFVLLPVMLTYLGAFHTSASSHLVELLLWTLCFFQSVTSPLGVVAIVFGTWWLLCLELVFFSRWLSLLPVM